MKYRQSTLILAAAGVAAGYAAGRMTNRGMKNTHAERGRLANLDQPNLLLSEKSIFLHEIMTRLRIYLSRKSPEKVKLDDEVAKFFSSGFDTAAIAESLNREPEFKEDGLHLQPNDARWVVTGHDLVAAVRKWYVDNGWLVITG